MRSVRVKTWPAPGSTWAEAIASWSTVEAAFRGEGPPVCPDPSRLPDCEIPGDVVLLMGTSGSTGTPKFAQLTARSLRASVDGVHAAMGGPGQWLLSVPPSHITGFQGVQRSFAAGFDPVALDPGPFTPESFVAGLRRLDDSAPAHYTTLVPTQLVRLLADPAAVEAARGLDRILVGGAPLPQATAARARRAGLRLALGYGASETSGGCVYDGRFLGCARGRLDEGRILVGGSVVASGYAGRPDLTEAAFVVEDGTRWFRTDDGGEFTDDGRLLVLGRLDDVVNTGGLKVAPRVVEEAIADACPEVVDVLVVGLPDEEWGEIVAAAIVVTPGGPAPSCEEIRARVDLPGHARPRFVLAVDALPLTGPGKHDRPRTRDLLAAARRP